MLAFAPDRVIAEEELEERLREELEKLSLRGERVLVIVPDDTRTLPMPTLFRTIATALRPKVRELTFMIALGTHPPLSTEQLRAHLGPDWERQKATVVQHTWQDASTLAQVGRISREKIRAISGGLLALDVPVHINREVLAHDLCLLVGPVFPHEVVGFSGGHKYLFPGVSGPDMVHASHWLGALITNPKVNGHQDTPVRDLIEQAAEFVRTPRLGLSLVMQGDAVRGVFLGDVREAWRNAAEHSAQVNITWSERSYREVLSMAPSMYRDLWTAGKCMYKLEPVIEDGGRLVIYAPHICEISETHGTWLQEVGYHVRDYFVEQWSAFAHVPWAVLAHSTHVKGIGVYRAGVERPRVEVVLATGIPEASCRKVNLGYAAPDTVRPEDYEGREEEGVLGVPNAGETLWRRADGVVPDVDRL